MLLVGFVAFFGVYYERYRCRNWAREGSFKTVEGVVENFHPEPTGGHGPETFTVGGVFFACSPNNLDRAGFNKTTRGGSPIRPGARVRICYQNGRILRLELFKAPNQNTALDAAMTLSFHVVAHSRGASEVLALGRSTWHEFSFRKVAWIIGCLVASLLAGIRFSGNCSWRAQCIVAPMRAPCPSDPG